MELLCACCDVPGMQGQHVSFTEDSTCLMEAPAMVGFSGSPVTWLGKLGILASPKPADSHVSQVWGILMSPVGSEKILCPHFSNTVLWKWNAKGSNDDGHYGSLGSSSGPGALEGYQ